VDIDLTASEGTASLTVKDDGRGFLGSPGVHRGMGLKIMEYRATIVGGALSIKRAADGGSIVVCSLTIPKALSQKSGQST
jgi:nitrate/nitrite-specific signal transduction histidine kinase